MTTTPNPHPVDPELDRFRELLSIIDPASLTKSDLGALLDVLAEAYKAKGAK